METKTIVVCTAIKIDVSCVRNDMEDIKCGGPAILGYDFYISEDEDIDFIKKEIKKCLKENNRPFIGISNYSIPNFEVDKLWDLNKIKECIKKYAL